MSHPTAGEVSGDPHALTALHRQVAPALDDVRRSTARAVDAIERFNRGTAAGHGIASTPVADGVGALVRLTQQWGEFADRVGQAFAESDWVQRADSLLATMLLAPTTDLLIDLVRATVLAGPVDVAALRGWPSDVLAALGSDADLPLHLRDPLNRAAMLSMADELDRPQASERDRRAVTALRELAATTSWGTGGRSAPITILRVGAPNGPDDEPSVVAAHGDLATADAVAYWMPGTTHGLHTWEAEFATAASIVGQVDQLPGAARRTAVVVDLYDAPDDLLHAALPSYGRDHAIDAAAAVADVDRLSGDARVTVIGHSYGTYAAGRAAAQGIEASALILLASPGTGARDAGELRPLQAIGDACAPQDGVFAVRAPHDMIEIPADVDEVLAAFSAGGLGAAISLGTDPADLNFGATAFEVNRPGLRGQTGWVESHSNYFNPTSASATNVARIVSGLAPTLPSRFDLDQRFEESYPADASRLDRLWTRSRPEWNLGTDGTRAQ